MEKIKKKLQEKISYKKDLQFSLFLLQKTQLASINHKKIVQKIHQNYLKSIESIFQFNKTHICDLNIQNQQQIFIDIHQNPFNIGIHLDLSFIPPNVKFDHKILNFIKNSNKICQIFYWRIRIGERNLTNEQLNQILKEITKNKQITYLNLDISDKNSSAKPKEKTGFIENILIHLQNLPKLKHLSLDIQGKNLDINQMKFHNIGKLTNLSSLYLCLQGNANQNETHTYFDDIFGDSISQLKNLSSFCIQGPPYYVSQAQILKLTNQIKILPKIRSVTLNLNYASLELKNEIQNILEQRNEIKEINIHIG